MDKLKHVKPLKEHEKDAINYIKEFYKYSSNINGAGSLHRLVLNERLRKEGGHIGYGIRPTERRKGYNKINLYLGLKCLKNHGVKEAFLDCDKDNLGSAKTIKSLGGRLIGEYYNDDIKCIVQYYLIDIEKSLSKNEKIYEPIIGKEK